MSIATPEIDENCHYVQYYPQKCKITRGKFHFDILSCYGVIKKIIGGGGGGEISPPSPGEIWLRTTIPFVTAYLEIFHCMYHPVISVSDLYFTFGFTINALSKRASHQSNAVMELLRKVSRRDGESVPPPQVRYS